jgi:hypothetical protein
MAQFGFPSPEVLQQQQIRSMKVYRTPLRFEGKNSQAQKFQVPDSIRQLDQIYYFNPLGKVETIIHYPTDSGFYKKDLFKYDAQNRLIEYATLDPNGNELNRQVIQQRPSNQWRFQRWEYGKLRERKTITADSIIYETLLFSPGDTTQYTAIHFDIASNLRTRSWKNERGQYSIETYQWFTEEGQPSSFTHTLEEKTEGVKKAIYKEKTYELDSAGNVINRYLGRFDDPYIHCNYYDRLEKFEPIYYPEKERFNAAQLIDKKELATLYTYDGVKLVYLYELVYEKR